MGSTALSLESSLNGVPDTPGTYMLLLRLDSPAVLTVGRLGAVKFVAGWYAYVGSALGAGGLRARVGRHLRTEKRVHWHIDTLTACALVAEIWWQQSTRRLECEWAQMLAGLPGIEQPAAGFGASDCTCRAHLFSLPEVLIDTAWEALGYPARVTMSW